MSSSDKGGEKDKEEIRKLRRERRKLKKQKAKMQKASASQKSQKKKKKSQPNKAKSRPQSRGRNRAPMARAIGGVRRVDSNMMKRWMAHILFPEWVPPARIPDNDSNLTSVAANVWEDSTFTAVTDGKDNTVSYFGIAMGNGVTSQFYRISSAGNAVAGDWTWTAVDNPKKNSFGTNSNRVRNIGTHCKVFNATTLSTMQGRWMIARLPAFQFVSTSSVTQLPDSVQTFTALRSCRECVANAPEADGVSVSHLHMRNDGTITFADPTSATDVTTTGGFTIIVWAGTAANAPKFFPRFTTSFEFCPTMGSEWLFSTEAWLGTQGDMSNAFQAAIEIWSAMGCTTKERRQYFKNMFGYDAPASAVDVGSDPTIGIALEGDQVRGVLRHLLSILPTAKKAYEKKDLSTEIYNALTSMAHLDVSDPIPDEKALMSQTEIRRLVREMMWLEDHSETEEKDSPRSTVVVGAASVRSRSANPGLKSYFAKPQS